ncbi:uncharacterized protein N7482_001020 [Penicillium canariense]|uniref:Uncharacterized protein n=1 Tax=Penicillium canariense TaxID=189055 RepID=A0A9W9LSI8_9EURO|nr:uncharacterized protein N7482_001020 [Penicillium canariense]KAJ5175143.1 hypothetical protein N7482_001020 [Penicillium canariense]
MADHNTTHSGFRAAGLNPSWKSLFIFTTRRDVPTLIIGGVFALLAGCVTPVLAVFLGNVFDAFTAFGAGQIAADGLRNKIVTSCFGMLGLGAAGWLLNSAYFALFIAFGELQASYIRSRVFSELITRDVEWFDAQPEGSGAFLSGIQAQIHDLQTATSQPLGLLFQYLCRSLASLGLAFYTSWRLSLVTLAGIPIFSAIIAFLSTRMKPSIEAQQGALTQASKIASNAISSIDAVKCLNGQKMESWSFSRCIEESAVHYLRQARLNSLQIAFIRWMMFGMFVQGFWYGSSLARAGNITSGEVMRTFWACLTAAQSIEQVLPHLIVMEKGQVASVMLRATMHERVEERVVCEMTGTLYPQHCEGDIEVNKVSFSYPGQPDRCVLRPSTFFFPAGDITFIIGKSGSGKSTLGQLLMRFYLPSSGEILIDGNPIETLDINWIRNNITLVEQRSVLFNDSVLKNIAFGRQDYNTVSADDVHDSIDVAMLQNMLSNLPNGLDTCVGPGGNLLSGGQKQRVAIARARLRDTPILILDEPTSALDHENRVAVMKAIREWRSGKTTIIITHDMSHITGQDFVYMLENGSIVQSGYRDAVEKQPGSDKYFRITAKDNSNGKSRSKSIDERYHGRPWEHSSRQSLANKPVIPPHARHDPRETSMQPHIRSSSWSGTWHTASRCDSIYSVNGAMLNVSYPLRKRGTFLSIPRREVSPARPSSYYAAPEEDLEMIHIDHQDSVAEKSPVPYLTLDNPESKQHSLAQRRRESKRQKEATEKGMASLSHIMGTIVPTLTPSQRIILFLGIVSALAHASATPIFSYCLSQLFGSFYAGTNSAKFTMKWSLAVLGVSVGDGLASFFMHYFLEVCGERWMDTLRKRAFQRVLEQPRAWFDQEGNNLFRLTAYLDQNGEDMRNLLGRFAGYLIVAASVTAMAIIWSLIVCWKLTLVALACGPLMYVIARGFEGINALWEQRCSEASRASSDIFTETFAEIRTVRTLTLEGYFHNKQTDAISKCLQLGIKRAIYSGLLFGMLESTVTLATFIFYYGAVLAVSEFTVNEVMMVFSLLLFGIGYAAQILSWIPQINTSREVATHLLRLSKLPDANSHEHRGDLKIARLTPIQLTNLGFRYPSRPNISVLKDVSITIAQNSCTAIVGRSGSGKSTIASLLLALYEAPVSRDGRPTVMLGGEDILRLHVPTLRSHVSIVSQQPTIFPGTIYANIGYGVSDKASIHSVRIAAEAAGIDEFILSLPKGYFTVIGDGGVGLSGGQKQRLAIARSLLRKPQILILDEATSSLDPVGAEVVRQTVQQLVATRCGLTVIIITHAKEMIEIADHVIVLDQGIVVEDGPYRVLAQQVGGRLYELVNNPDESGFS